MFSTNFATDQMIHNQVDSQAEPPACGAVVQFLLGHDKTSLYLNKTPGDCYFESEAVTFSFMKLFLR